MTQHHQQWGTSDHRVTVDASTIDRVVDEVAAAMIYQNARSAARSWLRRTLRTEKGERILVGVLWFLVLCGVGISALGLVATIATGGDWRGPVAGLVAFTGLGILVWIVSNKNFLKWWETRATGWIDALFRKQATRWMDPARKAAPLTIERKMEGAKIESRWLVADPNDPEAGEHDHSGTPSRSAREQALESLELDRSIDLSEQSLALIGTRCVVTFEGLYAQMPSGILVTSEDVEPDAIPEILEGAPIDEIASIPVDSPRRAAGFRSRYEDDRGNPQGVP